MKALVLTLLVMWSVPANAHEIRAGSLVIIHPTVDEAEKGQATARGSLEVRNEESTADTLLSITAEFAEKVTIETPGDVIVPSTTFHGIKRMLSEYEAYEGELEFAKAGTIKIDFLVHPHTHSSNAINLAQAPRLPFPAY